MGKLDNQTISIIGNGDAGSGIGASLIKLNENMIVNEPQISSSNSNITEEQNTFIEKQEVEEDVLKLTDSTDQNHEKEVNGLENFGLEEEQTTELFNTEIDKVITKKMVLIK